MAKTHKNSDNEEPNTAPQPDKWYNLSLGPSFMEHSNSSNKFYTLRYEFKPASIDKNQPGSLHKSKDNKVTVEYYNNQHGKPKVSFEGVCEDYKETDAVLFFDGESFRLERLHHAAKRLRHIRLPGDSGASATAAVAPLAPSTVETQLPGVGKGANGLSFNQGTDQEMPVQAEKIEMVDSESIEVKDENSTVHPLFSVNPSTSLPEPKDTESEGHVDIVGDDDNAHEEANNENASGRILRGGLDIDINLPHQADSDDEIADVDISDVEADKGPNAAETLRAQVNAEERKEQTSSTSSSSGTESSESGSRSGSESGSRSGSSSSDSESSEGDSITSV